MNKSEIMTISDEVRDALAAGAPVVALESSVFCQGVPIDVACELQDSVEAVVRKEGGVPATISVVDGAVCVGTSADDRARLIKLRKLGALKKIASRDLATASALKHSGGTTVSSTAMIAHRAGINVFATGGIGGMHRGELDISADLKCLASVPIVVVASGIKCILDVEKTLELLEALSVAVLSYRSELFPNFYCTPAPIKSPCNVESIDQIASISRKRNAWQMKEAMLVANPIDPQVAIDHEIFSQHLAEAMHLAQKQNITQQAVTPFLLQALAERTGQKTLKANAHLLIANAKLAAQIACEIK